MRSQIEQRNDCKAVVVSSAGVVLAIGVLLTYSLGWAGLAMGVVLPALGFLSAVALANSGWVQED